MKYAQAVIAATLAALATAELSSAAIIATDDFSYADGTLDGKAGGTGWTTSWANFVGTSANVSSGAAGTFNGGSIREYGAIQATGAVYFGVDMTFSATAVVAERYGGISSYDFGTERVYFGKTWDAATFGLFHVTTHPTSIAIVADTTYRVVSSIQFDTAGGQGRLKMWVNPDSFDFDTVLGNGALTTADLVVDYGNTGNWTNAIRLASGGSNNSAPVSFDNVVVATTFDSAAGVPEPTSLALAGVGVMLLARRRRL